MCVALLFVFLASFFLHCLLMGEGAPLSCAPAAGGRLHGGLGRQAEQEHVGAVALRCLAVVPI